MQIKTSINSLGLAALMLTNISTITHTGISEYCSPSKMGEIVWNHPKTTALVALATYILFRYYDKKPTTNPSRFNKAELKAKLEGKSVVEQLEILLEYMWYYYDDEVIGHNESKSKVKTDDSGNVVSGEAIPGKGYLYEVHKHKDAAIKTLCAPIVVAFMIALLEQNIEAVEAYQQEGLPGFIGTHLSIIDRLNAKALMKKKYDAKN